MNIFGRSSHDP